MDRCVQNVRKAQGHFFFEYNSAEAFKIWEGGGPELQEEIISKRILLDPNFFQRNTILHNSMEVNG